MTAPRIAVVGSYATGLTMRVDRLPNPGETVLGKGYRVDFGGKGSNQAVGCARLGAKLNFVTKIGQDHFGDMALGLYRDEGIDVASVIQVRDEATGVGFIIVDAEGNNCITVDPGANNLLMAEEVSKCLDSLTFEAVLTQLEIPVAAAGAAMARGREKGAVTILNPAPVRALPQSVLRLIDILTPNLSEAKVLMGRRPDVSIGPETVARELIQSGVKNIVMTLGEQGALLMTATSAVHIPAIRVSATDTTGAGDAFNAGLAVALASGATLEDAARFAVVTGGLAVTREGVIPSLPRREEVSQFYRQQNQPAPKWLQ